MGLRSWIRGKVERRIWLELAERLERAAKGGGAMDWHKVIKGLEAMFWFVLPLIIDGVVSMMQDGASIDKRAVYLLCLTSLAAYFRRQAGQ